jgi:hypothetical protein
MQFLGLIETFFIPVLIRRLSRIMKSTESESTWLARHVCTCVISHASTGKIHSPVGAVGTNILNSAYIWIPSFHKLLALTRVQIFTTLTSSQWREVKFQIHDFATDR